jgi:hypothetical protein
MIASDVSGWAQAGLAGLIAALGTTFWAGQANSSLQDARAQIVAVTAAQQADHDRITSLTADAAAIKTDVSETKSDVKLLLKNQAEVAAALRASRK